MIEEPSNETWKKEIVLLGEEGWELVSVTPFSWDTEDGHSIVNDCIYHFKREKKY